jgi:hypothetical protein
MGTLPPQGLFPEGKDKVRCENLLDILPVSAMRNGKYVFEAALRTPGGITGPPRAVRFSVGPSTSLPAPTESDPRDAPSSPGT